MLGVVGVDVRRLPLAHTSEVVMARTEVYTEGDSLHWETRQ